MIPYHPDDTEATKMQLKELLPAEKIPDDLSACSISTKVWDIMQRCWQWDPSARPNAQSVLADFEALELSNVLVQNLAVNHPAE